MTDWFDDGLATTRPAKGGFLTNIAMAVPTWIPSRLNSVLKTLGSGSPSGVSLPVLYLSPLRQSIAIWSKTSRIAFAHAGMAEAVEPGVV